MFKILICEESLSYTYKNIFASYDVTVAKNIEETLTATYEQNYDLYLFHFECYNLRKELKESGDTTPTIFIDEFYSIYNLKKAFKVGDDYLIKPLYLEELKIRVEYHYAKLYKDLKDILTYKEFYLHLSSKQLFHKTQKIKLSPNEIKLVELLFLNIDKPISKDVIYETLQSSSNGSLRVHISKLNKIGLKIAYERSTLSYTLQLLF